MSKMFLAAFLSALSSHVLAQGLVNFQNTFATLVTITSQGMTLPIGGPPGAYYFGLLAAPMDVSNVTDFAFTGLYATNLSVAGEFAGSSNGQVPGILPGQKLQFVVAGWTSEAGPTYQKEWVTFPPCGGFSLSDT